MSAAAAFFDLDKTLMAGSSGMEFARVARKRGMVSRRQLARWGWDHMRYRMRGATDDDTNEVLRIAKQSLSGSTTRELARMWPEVLAGILPRIYQPMLDEVYRHGDRGRETYIVSAAGNDMVESLARVLGMDGGLGTRYATDDGSFTGELAGPFVYGEGKVVAIGELAERRGIDLAASWAYSDSVSDLPMLQLVGNPVAVNPDPPLAELAAERGWRVMRFERLGRNLAVAGTVGAAVVIGGIGRLLSRSRPSRRPGRR